MHGALRWRWVALLVAHFVRIAASKCVEAGQAEMANSVLAQTQYCFPKGASLADTLTIRRDAHLCKLYWVIRRGGVRMLAAEDVACDEQSRSGPAESDLTQYVEKMLLGLHYCRARWRALNTTSVHNHLDGWVPHADDQAMHVAEGCVHHYVTLAKSRKHQTFVQQRHEMRARDRQASASHDAQQLVPGAVSPSPQLAEPTSSSVHPSLLLAATSPPEGSAPAATGMLQPLRMPPNMMKPPPDERFAKFSERTLTFVANTTHGAEAMFSVRVFGPRSLSAGEVRHVEGSTYEVRWRPAEAGLHRVHVRLEHQRFQEAVQGQNNDHSITGRPLCTQHGCTDIKAAEWVGDDLPMMEELVTVEPMETSEEPPLCSGGEELGYWSHWQQSSPALFVPPEPSLKSLGGCPATCNDPHSLVCETSEPVGKMQLDTQQPRAWLQYTAWEAYGCRYQQLSSEQALQCLARRKVRTLIVGDSVSMQLCSWLQCALRPQQCDPHCSHRTWPRNEYKQPLDRCVENQDGRSRDVVCVPIENFVGPFQRQCVPGTPCYHMRAVSDVWRTFSEQEVRTNIKAAMERHGMGTGHTEDVLLINVGLHDGTYGDFAEILTEHDSPWERLLRVALAAGFHRVIWNGAPAVHSYAEYTTDCSKVQGRHPDAGPDCQRRDYDPKKLLNGARSMAFNAFMRDTLLPKLNQESTKKIELLDMWQITRTREDATSEHSDKVHPCPQVYREVAKVFLNMLCTDERGDWHVE